MSRRGLTHEETVRFYDAFGPRQDRQGYYEDLALAELVRHARFERAQAVVEFGCGTGRFAAELLASYLSTQAQYSGWDDSATMVALASRRVAPFGRQAQVMRSSEVTTLPVPPASADRFVSNYVLDIHQTFSTGHNRYPSRITSNNSSNSMNWEP